ncbi:MAG: DnaD domain protein [Eubacteriales bacterium]
MSRLTIHTNRNNHTTTISNRFIDFYMKEANDAQLKIYLYLVRMMNTNSCTSVSEIADQFNHTEKDVVRALKYWETKSLLSLEYNESNALVGIYLKELREDDSTVIPFAPGTTQVLPPPSSLPAMVETVDKPSYSLDDISSFKETEDAAQLLFIIEQYLCKTLTPSDIRSIYFIYDELRFSIDLIDFLIQYCVERDKKDFRYIETVARNWAKEQITTPEEAMQIAATYDKSVYTVMKALGKSHQPTELELNFITRWKKELGFTIDIIMEACNRSVLATDHHRFEYANKILNSWHEQEVHSLKDIEVCDRNYMKTRNTQSSNNNTSKSANRFNQFAHNQYNFDELEKELISN